MNKTESETKHTPGPWNVYECEAYYRVDAKYLDDSKSDKLSTPWVALLPEKIDDEQLANARLIAAAPELYEALHMTRGQWIHSIHAKKCVALLAKVNGGQMT